VSDLIDALAVARITRLVVEDRVPFGPMRERIRAHYLREQDSAAGPGEPDPYLVELLECPWCASVWIAAGVLVVRRVAPRAWRPLACVLAASEVAGLAATWVEKG
jgi:Protein of unknown function (DUF1360)